MRHRNRDLLYLFAAALLCAACTSDRTCASASDCPAGYTCAFLISTCVYNPPPDLLGQPPPDLTPAPDLAAPPPDLAPRADLR